MSQDAASRLKLVQAAVAKGEVLRSPLWPQQQCSHLYWPGLEARPIHDPGRFSWLADVESAYPKIRAELEQLIEDQRRFVLQGQTKHGEHTSGGTWATFSLSVYGKRVEENAERCPETMRVLAAMPGHVGLATFSALAPSTHALPHYGTNNIKLRGHLGLRIPEGARMRLVDRIVTWEEGKVLVIDDSFQHEVWNTSDVTRYILLFDFFHPDLSEEERAFIRAYERRIQDAAVVAYHGDENAPSWQAR